MMKRIVDLVISGSALLLLLPGLAAIAFWIKLDSSGPVLFRQERVGRHGRMFCIHKFRTMVSDAHSRGPQLTVGNDTRVTAAGRFLRKYKLDELPQLIDVLVGDMSMVGPRPEVPQYVTLYSRAQREVLGLTPGITDPASIEFRREEEILGRATDPERHYVEVVMPRKIELNLEYGRHATVWSDLGMMIRTLSVIFR